MPTSAAVAPSSSSHSWNQALLPRIKQINKVGLCRSAVGEPDAHPALARAGPVDPTGS
jgi:hypothetical protein